MIYAQSTATDHIRAKQNVILLQVKLWFWKELKTEEFKGMILKAFDIDERSRRREIIRQKKRNRDTGSRLLQQAMAAEVQFFLFPPETPQGIFCVFWPFPIPTGSGISVQGLIVWRNRNDRSCDDRQGHKKQSTLHRTTTQHCLLSSLSTLQTSIPHFQTFCLEQARQKGQLQCVVVFSLGPKYFNSCAPRRGLTLIGFVAEE